MNWFSNNKPEYGKEHKLNEPSIPSNIRSGKVIVVDKHKQRNIHEKRF